MFSDQNTNFHARSILITMEDGCTAGGPLGNADSAPNWLQPDHAHPAQFLFYVRTPNQQFGGFFGPIVDLSEVHNPSENPPLHTTPKSVRIQASRDESYITAGPFEVLTQQLLQHLRQQPSLFPPVDYVYVTVPEGEMYRAPLKRQVYKEDQERIGETSSERGMMSPLRDYLLRMYHSH